MAEVSSELYIDSMNVGALIREMFGKTHDCIDSVNGAIASLHDAEHALKNSGDYADARTPVAYADVLRDATDSASRSLSTLNGALGEAWAKHREWSEKGHCLAPRQTSDALVTALGNVSRAALELDELFAELREESARYVDNETVRFVYDVCRMQSDAGAATGLREVHLTCEMQSRWIAELGEAAHA